MNYMANRLGAWQVGNDPAKGKVEFKIFFPSKPIADKGPKTWDPEIASIKVAGDFLNNNWNFQAGFPMNKSIVPEGTFWNYQTSKELDTGFYQYKYFITFNDGSTQIVSDPCTRYSGKDNQNAAFVIGGSQPTNNVVLPLANGRKPIRELRIYELHIYDFVLDYNTEKKAPLAAIINKLDYIQQLGFNAILFMPWTGWTSSDYSWGYEPIHYFSVAYQYANSLDEPAEKISLLKALISECHKRDIHVIMDGVYNHASKAFPYKHMYRNTDNCPYTGPYEGSFSGLEDLDFNNACTNEFIKDVCLYWIDIFKIDGIRFDNAVNFYKAGDTKGLNSLLNEIFTYVESIGENNFSLTIEHLQKDACQVVNSTKANSYWDNALYEFAFNSLWWKNIDSRLLNALNNQRFLNDANNVATLYNGNHDHSHVTFQSGVRDNVGSMRWYKTQPYAIALFTATAIPLVQAGTEFGEDHFIPENDEGTGRRIISRPIRWKLSEDRIGIQLRKLYQRLAIIRRDYEGLQSPNFYPNSWDEWQTQFNPEGYGVDTARQLAIYHRWGHTKAGILQKFMIVLNFSDTAQDVCVPFPDNGIWTDLLSNYSGTWKPVISNYCLCFKISSNWGHVFFKE
jgi:pullulanase